MSIIFEKQVVGPIEENCYIIWDEKTKDAAVIDPGGDPQDIVATIDEQNLNLKYILLTHAHLDHRHAAGAIAEKYGAAVALSRADEYLMADDLGISEWFTEEFVPVAPSIWLSDGDSIKLGDSLVEIIATPGHSKGGVCFMTDAGVFCGDTIFAASVGRTDLAGGSYEELISSINTKLMTLCDETPLFPGHGTNTTVGLERKRNPYL